MSKLRASTIASLHAIIANVVEDWAHLGLPDTTRRYCFRHGVAHLLARDEAPRAEKLLACFDYDMARLQSENGAGARALNRDCAAVLATCKSAASATFRIWEAFFRERGHILARGDEGWPAHKILLQLATEHLNSSPVTKAAEQYLASGEVDWIWLRERPLPQQAPDDLPYLILECGAAVSVITDYDPGRIITATCHGRIQVWSLLTGDCLNILEGHTDKVNGLDILDDTHLRSWSTDGTIRMWNLTSGMCENTINALTATPMTGVVILPKNRAIVWNGDGRESGAWLCDLYTGHRQRVLTEEMGGGNDVLGIEGVLKVAGAEVAVWGAGGLGLWNADTGTWVSLSADRCSALPLLNGQMLTWTYAGPIVVWDLTRAITTRIIAVDMVFDRVLELEDGRIVCWRTMGTWVRIYHLDTGSFSSFAVNEDGIWNAFELPNSRLMTWTSQAFLNIRDTITERCLYSLQWPSSITVVRPLKCGLLAMGDIIGQVALLDVNAEQHRSAQSTVANRRGNNNVKQWVFDNCIVGSDRLGVLTVRNQCASKDLLRLVGHNGPVYDVVSMEGNRLVSFGHDGTIRVWCRFSTECLQVLAGIDGSRSRTVAVTPISVNLLLSHQEDNVLIVWDLTTAQAIHRLHRLGHVTRKTRLLSDGRIATWSDDYYDGNTEVCIWKPDTGVCEHCLKAEIRTDTDTDTFDPHCCIPRLFATVLEVAGSRLVTWSKGTDDHTLRVWDLTSGDCAAVLEGHSSNPEGILKLDDGRYVSWDGEPRFCVWNGELDKCLLSVCLSENEWNEDFNTFWALLDYYEEIPFWRLAKRDRSLFVACRDIAFGVGCCYGDWAVHQLNSRNRVTLTLLNPNAKACWHASHLCRPTRICPDGNIQVEESMDAMNALGQRTHLLHCYAGNRRVTLAEAKDIVGE